MKKNKKNKTSKKVDINNNFINFSEINYNYDISNNLIDISNIIMNYMYDISNNIYNYTFYKKIALPLYIFNYIGVKINDMYMIDNVDKIKSKYDINKDEIKYFESQNYNNNNIMDYITHCRINAPMVSDYGNKGDYLYIYLLPFYDPIYKTYVIKIGQTGDMSERYTSHKKSFGCTIKLLLVIEKFEIKHERALHKILENLGNKKFLYKHKINDNTFKECYILCDIVMETVVNKINEVQKTKQMKLDIIIRKAEREQEFKQFHIQQLEETKKIGFQEETKQKQEETKQKQEETKQKQEETKRKQNELDVMIRKTECEEKTKQIELDAMIRNTECEEKTKQIQLEIELIKLKNLFTIN
jgi:hypothetical protein